MLWKGKKGLSDIYVVGCGQSLEGFSWPLLQNKTTIAINGSIKYVPNPDYFLTADSYFAGRAAHNGFWDVDTYKILVMNSDHKHFKRVKNVVGLFDHRIHPVKYNGEIGFSEGDFSTGQSSGFCGLQLAVILGAKTIHLLGIDFCGTGKGNFHKLYASNPRAWDEFYGYFVTAIDTLRKHGIQVVSHSPVSKLNSVITFRQIYE